MSEKTDKPAQPWAGNEVPMPTYPWKFLSACDKWFEISERGSTYARELVGGLTTFLSMVYILGVNPAVLTDGGTFKGQLWDSIFIATCLASFISTCVMAFVPNMPFALSCGLGLNAQVFLYQLGLMGPAYSFGGAMNIVFVEGVIFLIITLLGFREYIFDAIPKCIKSSLSVGIGLFIAFIGLQNASIVVKSDATLVTFVSIHDMYLDKETRIAAFNAIVCFIGLFAICLLDHFHVRGCVFFGIIFAALIGIAFGVTPVENITKGWNIGVRFKNFFSFDEDKGATFGLCFPGFKDAWSPGIKVPTTIVLIITYGMVDLFDTLGTFYGLSLQANLLDKETGKCHNFRRSLFADCVGAVCGAIFGTSSVTTYIESSTGIAAGARTGLCAFTTAVLFLLSMFISPIFNMLPGCATAPALIYVGVQMMSTVVYIDFSQIIDAIPVFLTIVMMPLTYSITNGMSIGILSYSVVHIVRFLFESIVYLIKKKRGVDVALSSSSSSASVGSASSETEMTASDASATEGTAVEPVEPLENPDNSSAGAAAAVSDSSSNSDSSSSCEAATTGTEKGSPSNTAPPEWPINLGLGVISILFAVTLFLPSKFS